MSKQKDPLHVSQQSFTCFGKSVNYPQICKKNLELLVHSTQSLLHTYITGHGGSLPSSSAPAGELSSDDMLSAEEQLEGCDLNSEYSSCLSEDMMEESCSDSEYLSSFSQDDYESSHDSAASFQSFHCEIDFPSSGEDSGKRYRSVGPSPLYI